MQQKRTKTNYINNAELFSEFVKFRSARIDDPNAKISDIIGSAILLICSRMARRPNFKNYSYIDEMISDGLESCVKAAKNFDPEKSNNPFAYLSQCIWYAFVKRILIEKKQSYVKHQMIEHGFVDSSYSIQQHDGDTNYMEQHQSYLQVNNTFDGESYARKLAKTHKDKQIKKYIPTPIEDLMVLPNA